MDKNKTYQENEQFNELPLPDAEQSWQKMKAMLDEEDNRNRPVVPFTFKSCTGWGLGFLLTAALAWIVFGTDLFKNSKDHDRSKQTVVTSPAKNLQSHSISKPENSYPSFNKSTDQPQNPSGNDQTTKEGHSATNEKDPYYPASIGASSTSSFKKQDSQKDIQSRLSASKHHRTIKAKDVQRQANRDKQEQELAKSTGTEKQGTDKQVQTEKMINNLVTDENLNEEQKGDTVQTQDKRSNNSQLTIPETIKEGDDTSALVKKIDSLIASPDTAVVKANTPDQLKKKKSFILSAGLGLQQQIPISEQKTVPYDEYGRENSIYDYIPSAYVRLEKKSKWFVQGEFRYGAPQSLKEFSYSRQTRIDTSNFYINTTSYRLKKTYYHQLPLSFNYYILPNLSVGAGGIYSRFSGAVSEKEVRSLNIITQQETVSRQMVNQRQFNDSFLYKTQVHLLLQAEYHWRRFTVGLRYTKDVQPFIRYTQPDGRVNEEKNQTLQVMVRFRLWQKEL